MIKISAVVKYPTSNLNLLHLKYVDKAAAELWVEVQIEQMSFVLLLLQNLTMSKIRCFICVFTFKTFIFYHHKVKTNLGEDVSGCALLFALLLCGLCLLSCFLYFFCNIFNPISSCFRLLPVISFFCTTFNAISSCFRLFPVLSFS